MKRFSLKENGKGNFDIQKFGTSIAGADGKMEFSLIICSSDRFVNLEVSGTTAIEMFERFDPSGNHYQQGIYFSTDYIRVERFDGGCNLIVKKAFFRLLKDRIIKSAIKNSSLKTVIVATSSGEFLNIPSNLKNQSAA